MQEDKYQHSLGNVQVCNIHVGQQPRQVGASFLSSSLLHMYTPGPAGTIMRLT